MRPGFVLLALLLLPTSSCTCSGNGSLCPESFVIGEGCPSEGLRCEYPGSLCGTTCVCNNSPGGFTWECEITMCRCTCPCGKIAIASCESLECAEESDPCPPVAVQSVCEVVVCVDGGVRDKGVPDGGGDATPIDGLRRDAPVDLRPGEGKKDGPRPDQARDQPLAQDAKKDAPGDGVGVH